MSSNRDRRGGKASDGDSNGVLRAGAGARRSQFIQYNLGSCDAVDCTSDDAIWPDDQSKTYPVWGRVYFRDDPFLQLPGLDRCIRLRFSDLGNLRRLRARSATFESLGLPLVRVEPFGDDVRRCRLVCMFPAKSFSVEVDIPIMIEPQVFEDLGVAANTDEGRRILMRIVLEACSGDVGYANGGIVESQTNRFLVRQAPRYFQVDQDDEASSVNLLIHDGGAKSRYLLCRIEENAGKSTFLRATAVKEVSPERDKDDDRIAIKRVHLIKMGGKFVQIRNPGEAFQNNLYELIVQGSTLLGAWTRYHELEAQERARLFRQRADHELLFSDPQPKGDKFEVRINQLGDEAVVKAWCDLTDDDQDRNTYDVDAPVDIYSRMGRALMATGRIVLISPKTRQAIIEMDEKKVPDEAGNLVARQMTDRQSENRRDAVARLEQGNVAMPHLLDILNDPAAAPIAKRRTTSGCSGELNPRQREAVEYACGSTGLVAIQGPPGTGKTHVIVEVVSRLFSEAEQRGETAPRILISSTQNVAVDNALKGLKTKGYFMNIMKSQSALSREATSGSENGNEIRQILQDVKQRLASDIHLDRQVKFLEAANQAMKFLLDWPVDDADVQARLLEIVNFNAFDDAIVKSFGSLVSDAARYLREFQRIQQIAEVPKCGNEMPIGSCENVMEDIQAVISVQNATALDCSRLVDMLSQLRDDSVCRVMDAVIESGLDAAKTIRRALRDGRIIDADEALGKYRKQISLELQSQSLAKGKVGSAEFDDVRARIAAWRLSMIELLSIWQDEHKKTRVGVLEEWKRSLEEEPQGWKDAESKYAQVVGATCQMVSMQRNPANDTWFDYAIIDEAARSEVFDLLIPMVRAKRILLVGDQRQLPPMLEHTLLAKLENDEACDVRLLKEQSLFGEIFEQLPSENRIMLDVQYRSNPAIGDALSKAFYDGCVNSGPGRAGSDEHQSWLQKKQPRWELFGNRPIVWVDSDPVVKGKCWQCCEEETNVIFDIVQAACGVNGDTRFGVIAFYAKQIVSLRAKFRGTPLEDCVEIGTVDSFQGKEYPVVLLCCSRHDPAEGRVGFLNLPNRMLVALSRVQSQLIIIGSKSTLLHETEGKGCAPLKSFVSHAGAAMCFASPLEDVHHE